MTDNITAERRAKKLETIRGLFRKAQDVAGTPEADVFNEKAIALLAKYGIDEAEALRRDSDGPAPIVHTTFNLSGKYLTVQRSLLQMIAESLHCSAITAGGTFSSPDATDYLYGTELNVDRVRVLFSMLNSQMLVGASRVKPPAGSRTATATFRRSWMLGFYQTISERLGQAETQATEAAGPGAALVLVDEAKRANEQLRADLLGPRTRVISNRYRGGYDPGAGDAGKEAGNRANVGDTALNGRRALTA
ncbi:DUF2786 domain-containing protein [Prescottella equi]|uniref:DUF2786 domain-containing protein n=1 Tax=Rhodococcus hoagii TaxID=43767 RepID=UPI000D0EFCE0|nr:DUF2786 domain-containing protein [Prescottella equi]AVP71321.1 hypothetical protein C7H75_24885 [Prescottella equi]